MARAITVLAVMTLACVLISESLSQKLTSAEKKGETKEQSGPEIRQRLESKPSEWKPKVRRRVVKGARTVQGSINDGLRSDYLLSITLPCTLGMFGFVILLLVCMRTDGWLYHLFTDDYVPPAVRKRMEEEARRTQGKKARMEREDNWNEVRKTWETDLTDITERVKATMPPDPSSTAH